jgi:hypothetical protein
MPVLTAKDISYFLQHRADAPSPPPSPTLSSTPSTNTITFPLAAVSTPSTAAKAISSFSPTSYNRTSSGPLNSSSPNTPPSGADLREAPILTIIVLVVLLSLVLGTAVWFCWWSKRNPWQFGRKGERRDREVVQANGLVVMDGGRAGEKV